MEHTREYIEAQRKILWSELDDPDFPQAYEVVKLGDTAEKELLTFTHNDGGRKATGRDNDARDCVARAIAIISGEPYDVVHKVLSEGTGAQRASKRTPKRTATADNGINTQRKWFKDYMSSLGFTWHPTMKVGQLSRTRLNKTDLPHGKLIVALKKHYTAVIDGQLHDTYDCSYHGRRVVLGYWKKTS